MRSVQTIRRGLARVAARAAAALFIIPAIVWMFTAYALSEQDAAFLQATREQAASAVESQAQVLEAFRSSPPSTVCSTSGDARIDAFRAQYCEPLSTQWQFVWANRLAKLTVAAGVLLLLAAAGLGLLAFRNRAAQYRSVVTGWRVLVWGSVAEVVMQSVMLVWLVFWLPVYFFNWMPLQVVGVVGLVAGLGVMIAVREIFRKFDEPTDVEGEIVTSEDAPGLWSRIRDLAAKVGTEPPRNVVAGIDTNFFVTESELRVADRILRGRSLFVSLPLLRILDTEEADAVLAHELAHLSGGDAASRAALSPKLSQFNAYLDSMSHFGSQLIAFHLLALYRFILELALQKESREREFVADLVAARHVSPAAVARSLVKVTGYSAYRNRVEQELFSRERKFDGDVGIAVSVADGLHPFAHSADFGADVAAECTPHPFDSHPSLVERMGSVGAPIDQADYAAVLMARDGNIWIDAMPHAPHVEQRLWAGYEERFRQAHALDLAYRYLPGTDEERELVERYFPPRTYDLNRGRSVVLTYDALSLPGHRKSFNWGEIKSIAYEDGLFGDILAITLHAKVRLQHKTARMRLRGIRKQRDELKAMLGQYWQRHRVAHATLQG